MLHPFQDAYPRGETREEALKNTKEAIELYLEPDTNELIDFSGEKVKVIV